LCTSMVLRGRGRIVPASSTSARNLTDPGRGRGRLSRPPASPGRTSTLYCVGRPKSASSESSSPAAACRESKAALHLCRDQLTARRGPSSEMESDPAGYLNSLRQLVEANRDLVSAVGETGLDYDREHFAPREVQMRHFRSQVSLACQLRLPLFLHCRASHAEFRAVLSEFASQLPSPPGVVHTFDGSAEDAAELLAMGFYLGLNGLKTADNLRVVSGLPLDRLLLETDAPWCEVKPSHAGHSHVTPSSRFESRKAERWSPGCMVKGRNEPACILQVLQVVAATLGQPAEKVASAAFANTCRLFGLAEAAAPSTVEGDN
uniref:Deoxyribonuclease TATDN1 n=1 Tax=Macrostomum lignano TaxID=282301 RepID=A0A1I8HK78_9PLAT